MEGKGTAMCVQDDKPLVFIIDDDASLREALVDLLGSVSLDAVSYASPEEFFAARWPDTCACIVSDVRMPGLSGLEFQRRLQDMNVDIPIIFITAHGDIPMSVQAMKAGSVDFLPKPFREQDLLDAIQEGIGRHRESRRARRHLESLKARHASLNEGERAVFRLIARGLINKQAAADLHVSEVTVKVRRARVMRKMQASSMAELVRMAEHLSII